ncbi:MAG: hypothetical protein WC955_11585 [Elusimicrobiota bacterium]
MKIFNLNAVTITILCTMILSPVRLLIAAPLDLSLSANMLSTGGTYAAAGGAFAADETLAMICNPAGLSWVTGFMMDITYGLYSVFPGVTLGNTAICFPISNYGAAGLSWQNVSAELMQGNPAAGLQQKSVWNENLVTLAYGFKINNHIRTGIALKRYVLDTSIGNGAGMGFDFGAVAVLGKFNNFAVGMVAKNVVADIKNEAIPADYRIGFSWAVFKKTTIFSADVDTKTEIAALDGTYVSGMNLRYHAGVDIMVGPAGIHAGYDNGGGTFGLSVIIKKIWVVGIGYASYPSIGDTYRISLIYKK